MSSKSFAPIIFILAILGCINSGRAQSRTIADQADSAMVMIKLSDIQREYERITTEAPQMVSSYADSSLINSINTGLLKTSQNFKNLVFGADEILSHYLRSWQILNLRNKLNRANSNFETLSNSASTAAVNIERSLSQIEKDKKYP